jgi:hypothetical protein
VNENEHFVKIPMPKPGILLERISLRRFNPDPRELFPELARQLELRAPNPVEIKPSG